MFKVLIHLLMRHTLLISSEDPQTNFYVCYDPLRDFLDVALDRGSYCHHSFTVRVYKEDSR